MDKLIIKHLSTALFIYLQTHLILIVFRGISHSVVYRKLVLHK